VTDPLFSRSAEDGHEPARPIEDASNSASPTRRGLIAGAGAIGAAAVIGGTGRAAQPTAAQSKLIDTALAASTTSGGLGDIKHFVILVQENRSFDHYFGTLSGVRGFSDPNVPTQTVGGSSYPVFDQYGYAPGTGVTSAGYTQPFRLLNDPPLEEGQTTNDIDHGWAGQHNSWNNGAMDSFIKSHLSTDGSTNGPVAMGYYTRADLPFYYALGDGDLAVHGGRLPVLGHAGPHLGAEADRDPLRRRGAEPLGVAPPDRRRLHRRVQLRHGAGARRPEAAEHQHRQHGGRGRGGHPGARGHPRRRYPVPAADLELDARAGDRAEAAQVP